MKCCGVSAGMVEKDIAVGNHHDMAATTNDDITIMGHRH